ncbi:MAG: glycosyltransferase [Verrucomicrobiota bacterium]
MTTKLSLFTEWQVAGGIERVMLNLAGGLAALGLGVDLVVARDHGLYPGLLDPRVRLIDLKASSMLASIPALVRYLREARPAAVLSAHEHANVAALWANKLSRASARMVISIHSLISARVGDRPVKLDPWLTLAAKCFYHWADDIVAVSRGVADDFGRRQPSLASRVSVVPNPLITPSLFHQASQPVDHAWFRPGEPPVVLSAGRLCAPKDFATLLNAFAQVRRLHSARLVILGDGPDRASLCSIAESLGIGHDVALLGFQANPFAFMQRAAVFVLSSQNEGMPSVLIEAFACGVPVVATGCPGGVSEALAQGRHGHLVPVGDAGALASALSRVLQGGGIIPREESWKPFLVDSVARQYRDILLP